MSFDQPSKLIANSDTAPELIIWCGLSSLMNLCRSKLLRVPDPQTKIHLAQVIYDCAHARDLLNLQPDDLETITTTLSLEETIQTVLRTIDRATVSLREFMPTAMAISRRAIENTADLFSIPHRELRNSDPQSGGWTEIGVVRPGAPIKPERYQAQLISKKMAEVPIHLRYMQRKAMDVELSAVEVCAAIPLLFPEIPPDLDLALALQSYDEARHVRALVDAIQYRLDIEVSRTSGTMKIWENLRQATNLTEALCIEEVLGEAYSIGTDLFLAHALREQGYIDLADIEDVMHADEIAHAAVGVMWFLRLAGDTADQLICRLESRFANSPPVEPWFRSDLRRCIGFTSAQIERQRLLARPVDWAGF